MSHTTEKSELHSVCSDDNTGRAVRVRWVDSGLAVGLGWKNINDVPDNVETVETVGLWMGENANVIVVGGTRDMRNDSWLSTQLIFKPCITKMEWLS